tara:strand:- start:1985 stop:2470 length:486 start_codon:yes stop_codon:yes gene_type:complete
MDNFKVEFYLKITLIISLVSIISAYFIQYGLGYQPCNLCLIERIPYGLAIFLLALNYFFKKNEKFLILLLIIIFLFSLIISIYHLGIEQGFFEESAVCNVKNAGEIVSKEELLKQLQKKTVSCKDVTFKIFGISLTSFNIIISFIILALLTKIFISYEKNK